jgi:hypothetical protein
MKAVVRAITMRTKGIYIILVFFFLWSAALAQNSRKLEAINQVGWEISNFSSPGNLSAEDSGEVTYLITLTDAGRLKNIRVLSSTFSKRAERIWRRQVRKVVFTRNTTSEMISNQGTFHIKAAPCNLQSNQ